MDPLACCLLNSCAMLERAENAEQERRRREASMPLIQVKVIEGVFSAEQKREMIRKLTDAMVAIEGENMRQVTSCIIEEVKSGDWGIAGNPLTTGDVKALAAGKTGA